MPTQVDLEKNTAWNTRKTVSVLQASYWNLQSRPSKIVEVRYNSLTSTRVTGFTGWNVNQSVSKLQLIYWILGLNPDGPVVKSQSLWFNTRFTTQSLYLTKWNNLRGSVVDPDVYWNTLESVTPVNASTSWMTRQQVDRLVNSLWNTDQRISKLAALRYNTLDQLSKLQDVTWETLSSVSKLSDVGWILGLNPDGPVVVNQGISFNNLSGVTLGRLVTWNEEAQIGVPYLVQYNVLEEVDVTGSVNWLVSTWVNSHIRQLAQQRIDFIY